MPPATVGQVRASGCYAIFHYSRIQSKKIGQNWTSVDNSGSHWVSPKSTTPGRFGSKVAMSCGPVDSLDIIRKYSSRDHITLNHNRCSQYTTHQRVDHNHTMGQKYTNQPSQPALRWVRVFQPPTILWDKVYQPTSSALGWVRLQRRLWQEQRLLCGELHPASRPAAHLNNRSFKSFKRQLEARLPTGNAVFSPFPDNEKSLSHTYQQS